MYRPHASPNQRKGIILLVVLAMLTLFTVVGISFVLYADAAATQARVAKDSNVNFRPEMEPEECLSFFLDQLIFDVRDDESGVYSSLRGHSLARNMYGFDYTWADLNGAPTPDLITLVNDDVPFNGVGRLHYEWAGPIALTDPNTAAPTNQPVDDWKMVNYMYYNSYYSNGTQTSDKFVRDPERYGYRTGLRQPGQADNRGPYLGGANVSYTYPDLNNYYLGAIDGSGDLLASSFHREWLFGRLDGYPGNSGGVAVNANWTNTVGKYLTARPRPNENPNFPYPGDRWGDVKNLVNFPGGNDSIWMDIGAPVRTTPDGRTYKMLVAPLILELDGRLNLNAHGNPLGLSNFGLGPWEVNLGLNAQATDGILTATVNGQPEYIKIYPGNPSGPKIVGRYGPNNVPVQSIPSSAAANYATGLPTQPHSYGQFDYQYLAKSPVIMPNATPVGAQLSAFPFYPNTYQNGGPTDLLNHPVMYNPFTPFAPSLDSSGKVSGYYNRQFALSNSERFYRWGNPGPNSGLTGYNSGDTNIEALSSELERLLPMNFNDPNNPFKSFWRRNLITLLSGDRNQAGIPPYVINPTASPYAVSTTPAGLSTAPTAATNPVFPTPSNNPTVPSAGSDFSGDWRNNTVATAGGGFTSRLDLNYPIGTATGSATGPTTIPTALTPYPTLTANARFDQDAYAAQFIQAQSDRQAFARAIYNRLMAVTCVPPVATLGSPTLVELRPRRWLAQLAVNMVDFIDNDDISTPFNFYSAADATNPATGKVAPAYNPNATATLPGPINPTGVTTTPVTTPLYWVFGTELPRVVINEVLGEYTVPTPPKGVTTKAGLSYPNKVWVELYNPMPGATGQNTDPNDIQPVQLGMPAPSGPQNGPGSTVKIPANTGAYSAYQVIVGDEIMLPTAATTPTAENNNVLGLPLNIRSTTASGDFASNGTVYTISNALNGGAAISPNTPATIAPQSFMLLAPAGIVDNHGTIAPNNNAKTYPNGRVAPNTPIVVSGGMQYTSKYTTNTVFAPNDTTNGVAVFLQRLANPHIPYNPTISTGGVLNPWYNPYVTIDYMDHVTLNQTTAATYASHGKTQPYAGYSAITTKTTLATTSPVKLQTAGGATPLHTFGAANSPLPSSGHYDWLTHLDRQLISPIELLNVSQFQPHQLTQQFMRADPHVITSPATGYQHAPWLTWYNDSTRIYRVLELMQTNYQLNRSTDNLRATGKININAIWDYQTFLALCDPQNCNDFNETQVQAAWNTLIALRSGNTDITGRTTPAVPVPGPTGIALAEVRTPTNTAYAAVDRPFLSLGTGLTAAPTAAATRYAQYQTERGIDDTLLRSATANGADTTARLFDYTPTSGTDSPYVKSELLRKIFNNTTTRSNVFAVWVTVGFFEVTNTTTRPVQLGAEMNASEGRQIRHRAFAIIDRSTLQTNPYPSTVSGTSPQPKTPFRPGAPPAGLTGLVPYWAIIE